MNRQVSAIFEALSVFLLWVWYKVEQYYWSFGSNLRKNNYSAKYYRQGKNYKKKVVTQLKLRLVGGIIISRITNEAFKFAKFKDVNCRE